MSYGMACASPNYASRLHQPLGLYGVIYVQQVQGNLVISYCRTKPYGQISFAYSGPALWNSLPLTLTQFCEQLKAVIFFRSQWYIPTPPRDSLGCKVYSVRACFIHIDTYKHTDVRGENTFRPGYASREM